MRRLTGITAVALLAISLTACGNESDQEGSGDTGNESSAPPEASVPACDEVWVEGETLPEDYEGCDLDGTVQAAVYYDCADGRKFAAYGGVEPNLWAFYGDAINAGGVDDESYAEAFASC